MLLMAAACVVIAAALQAPGEDIDARIGAALALLRQGAWQEALPLLRDVERKAGENADLFHALALAYRRSGDDGRALEYYTRAKALSPADPDVSSGLDNVLRAYGHSIAIETFNEQQPEDVVASVAIAASVRVNPRVHVESRLRAQHRSESVDVLAGGGIRWRAGRVTNVGARALAGPANTVLATSDISAELVTYTGAFEWGGSARAVTFAGSAVAATSAMLAWEPGAWRLDGRYTYSRSRFDESGDAGSDHSALLRGTWHAWRRVSLVATAAYGIESFETLTADRVDALAAATGGAGVRLRTASVADVHLTWEHQWRADATATDRITLAVIRSLR